MLQLKFLLSAALCLALVAAEQPTGEIKEAIDYLNDVLPDTDMRSEASWNKRMYQAIMALKSHPKFSKIIAKDEAKAAAEADKRSNFQMPAFNCQLPKSSSVPTSVHRLRPADVNVVAAMGDSLTAANGAKARFITDLIKHYRGYAWSIGGQVTLDKHVTLANILRKANSNLYGFSTGTGDANSAVAKLNVAVTGNEANHMPGQARELVKRLRSDSNVDFNKDWKVITLFVGGNDLCRYCSDKSKYSVANYIKYIKEALDILHAEVPRAFVNVFEPLDVSLAKKLKYGSGTCMILQGALMCKCGAYPENEAAERELAKFTADYQAAVRSLISSGRYDTRSDFTVVNQPFYRNTQPPLNSAGRYDQSYFSLDCFHFSDKGHATAAKALWNNMLEPEGRKSTEWDVNSGFLCPTSTRPYLRTRKN